MLGRSKHADKAAGSEARGTGASAKPRRREDGHETVVKALREDIVGGELSPNEHLVELDLAARFGVGRATIRSALLELAKEGLVERERNRGARVRQVTLAEAIEITEARLVNEGLLASKAAERATEAEVEELARIVSGMKEALEAGDTLAYSGLNERFHASIRELSRHSTAASIVEGLRNQVIRHRFRVSLLPGRLTASQREHEAILGGIAAGDPGRAEAAMHEHLRSVIDALKRTRSQQRDE